MSSTPTRLSRPWYRSRWGARTVKVQIAIRGRPFTLRSDKDEDLRAIGAYVESQIEELAKRSPQLDDYSLAVLAALNIAAEYERFRRDVESDLGELDRELASVEMLVAASLPEKSKESGG